MPPRRVPDPSSDPAAQLAARVLDVIFAARGQGRMSGTDTVETLMGNYGRIAQLMRATGKECLPPYEFQRAISALPDKTTLAELEDQLRGR